MSIPLLMVHAIDSFYLMLIFSFIGAAYRQNKLKYLISSAIFFIFIVAVYSFIPGFEGSTTEPYVSMAVLMGLYLATFREGFFKTIFYFIFGFIIVVVFEIIAMVIFTVCGISVEDMFANDWLQLAFESVKLVFIFTLAQFEFFRKRSHKLTPYVPYIVSFALHIFIFLQMSRIVTYWLVNGGTVNLYYLYTLFFALVITNVLLIRFVIVNRREAEQIKSYNEYEKMIIPLIENSRALEHDFKNHLLTLKSMSKGNDEKINDYIEEVHREVKNQSVYKLCSNPVVGALLQEKHGYAVENDIDFDIEIYENQSAPKDIKPHHLITVLSNLIDNAFEESKKSEDKRVKLRYEQKESVSISVVNSLSENTDIAKMDDASRYSTKGKNRGYGLGNIKKIAKLYKGDVKIYHLGQNIEIKVSLNL